VGFIQQVHRDDKLARAIQNAKVRFPALLCAVCRTLLLMECHVNRGLRGGGGGGGGGA
jgi:hypothetical protein